MTVLLLLAASLTDLLLKAVGAAVIQYDLKQPPTCAGVLCLSPFTSWKGFSPPSNPELDKWKKMDGHQNIFQNIFYISIFT